MKILSITCPGNVFPGNVLSGKVIVRETSVKPYMDVGLPWLRYYGSQSFCPMHHFTPATLCLICEVYAMARCLCVRPSVTNRSSIQTAGRIELVFGTGATCTPQILHYVILEFRYLKNKVSWLLNLVPNFELSYFFFI